jgi:hypothetical protein
MLVLWLISLIIVLIKKAFPHRPEDFATKKG